MSASENGGARQAAALPEQPSPGRHYQQQPTHDSWRFNANTDDVVGVGAYFGRLEGQHDSVARVKSLVPGGPAEQTGLIEVGDALCTVDDVDVYGQPLCELGKHVLGPSGTVVKLAFEKRKTGERYVRTSLDARARHHARVHARNRPLPLMPVRRTTHTRARSHALTRSTHTHTHTHTHWVEIDMRCAQVTHLVRGKGVLTVM
jgi:hypothetical protein